MKVINISNWSLIGLYALAILFSALRLKQTTDAAGWALGSIYLIVGTIALIILVGANLMPFLAVKIIVFILLVMPSLYGAIHSINELYETSAVQEREVQRADGSYYFTDAPRQQIATAIANLDTNRLQTLLSQSTPFLNKAGNENTTLLDFAAMKAVHNYNPQDALLCVSLLLQKGAAIQIRTPGHIPTHALVGRECSAELLSLLLKQGANPDAQAASGLPLLLAILDYPTDRTEKINVLLKHHANPNCEFPSTDTSWLRGHSALLAAGRMELWDICQLLLENGADISFEGPQNQRFPELIEQNTRTYEQMGSTPSEFSQLKAFLRENNAKNKNRL
ncbi:hypothetical protein IC229_26145 [Spirosoma sp. BT702]|uniref:Ankyrin repeat domain-containing protein n=1 Tax=Spirosoma profusum TaxID=2771354 RepID=A0A926Y057_9BACT|nr:hypothetical protein [Spirosoma profusum]MBD2704154.1 hypothetical protein [Spirosoma profusum]